MGMRVEICRTGVIVRVISAIQNGRGRKNSRTPKPADRLCLRSSSHRQPTANKEPRKPSSQRWVLRACRVNWLPGFMLASSPLRFCTLPGRRCSDKKARTRKILIRLETQRVLTVDGRQTLFPIVKQTTRTLQTIGTASARGRILESCFEPAGYALHDRGGLVVIGHGAA